MNPHLKQLWAAMRLPENFKKSYKFFCRGLDIRVTQVVNANALYASVFAAALHFTIKIAFRDWKQPIIQANVILHLQILLDFICQKERHGDSAIALFCLGRCDDVFSASVLKCLADCNCAFVKIEIFRGQRQQFSLTDTTPVKHLKSIKGQRLVHHSINEFQVFIFGPEQHFAAFLLQPSEIGQQFGSDNVALALPGAVFDAVSTIFLVTFDKVLKSHVKVSAQFVKLFPFPSLRLSFRLKASLLGLLALSGPVCVAVDYPPCIVFLIPCKQPIELLLSVCTITGTLHKILSVHPSGDCQNPFLL